MHQRKLTSSCFLAYFTPSGEVNGMLRPRKPKIGSRYSESCFYGVPFPLIAVPRYLLVSPRLSSSVLYIRSFFSFLSRSISLQIYLSSPFSLVPSPLWSHDALLLILASQKLVSPAALPPSQQRHSLSHSGSRTCRSSPHPWDADRCNGSSPCGARIPPE